VRPSLRSLLPNLLLSVASVAAFLALAEGVSRGLEPPSPPNPFDETIADWASWDGEFYTIKSMGTGRPPWDEFNRDGVRDRDHALEAPPGYRRLVFLGDSTTLGFGVSAQEAYPQVLQDLSDAGHGRMEVFNVALAGWATRQERIAYERIVRKYRPAAVVLAVCLNDIPEMQNNLTRPPVALRALHRRSALVRLAVGARRRQIRAVRDLFDAEPTPAVRDGYRLFFDEVRRLHAAVRADGPRLALLVLPYRFQVEEAQPSTRAQETIASFCVREGLPLLDALPILRPAGPAAFLDDDHLSAEGHRRLAQALFRWPDLGFPASAPEYVGAITVALLVERLGFPEPAERAAAALQLGRRGVQARPAVPALIAALDDADGQVRWRAGEALAAMGAPAEDCLEGLAAIVARGDAPGRGEAAAALGRLGPAAAPAVAVLAEALRDNRADVRARAALALGSIGPPAGPAAGALAEALRDAEVRWQVAEALGGLEAAAAPAVPALIEALRDPTSSVRLHAARSLGRIGHAAAAAAPALADALRDPQTNVRAAAVRALVGRPQEVGGRTQARQRALHDDDPRVRDGAARELARLREP
jgi:HEAT repeat protein/lysophospholipase L1-like esterase